MSHLDHLLQPTLTEDAPHRPLYSVRAGFFVAFFGGVHAALIFSFLNSRRLSRVREDLWLYVVVGAVWAAALVEFGALTATSDLPQWLTFGGDAKRGARFVTRAVGMLVYGLCYLRLRRFYKAAEIAGDAAPSPWLPGLGAVAAGIAINFAAVALGLVLAQ